MRDEAKEYERRNAQVLLVVAQRSSLTRHLLRNAGLEPNDIGYPILADPFATISATYGVAFQVFQETWSNRPATFIIDHEGTIRSEYRAGKHTVDQNRAEYLLKIIDELEATKKPGEQTER